jgi:integrase
MSIRLDKVSGLWQLDITDSSGKRLRQSSGTRDRAKAQELHDTLVANAWRQKRLGEKPDHPFDELVVAYLKSIKGDRYYSAKAKMAEYWLEKFSGKSVRSLTTRIITEALPSRKRTQRPVDIAPAMSPATQNRYLASIGKMLSIAVELEWLDASPRIKRGRESRVNVRWITQEEASTLIAACKHEWLANVVKFALATGCRAGEILSLDWSQVDVGKRHAYIKAENAKSGYSRGIPLNDLAIDALPRTERSGRVFTCRGNPITTVSHKAFQRACTLAGIDNFRFHDLRHTWASWHAQNGTPLLVLKELGGWRELSMIQKYAHLGVSHLATYAGNTEFKPIRLKIAV